MEEDKKDLEQGAENTDINKPNEGSNESENPSGESNTPTESTPSIDETKTIYTIVLRHDILENWMLNDPILAEGEYAVEDDTHKVKRGDGLKKWSELPYETFGIETLIIKKAEDIAYDNTKSTLTYTNVQDVIDYILSIIPSDNNVSKLQAQIDALQKAIDALKGDKLETGDDNTGDGPKDPEEEIPVG